MRFFNSVPPSIRTTSSLVSSAMALKHQKSALEKSETITLSGVPTTVSNPLVCVAVPGIPPNTHGIMTPDSAPESILFVDTEFDLERVKWLLDEYREAKSRPVIS